MTVEVKFFANFREMAGEKEVCIKASNVRELLEKITKNNKNLRDELFSESGSLVHFVNILVDGRRVETLDGLDTELNEGDEVAIFPPVSGG